MSEKLPVYVLEANSSMSRVPVFGELLRFQNLLEAITAHQIGADDANKLEIIF